MSWKDQLHKDIEIFEFETVLPGSKQKVKFKPTNTKTLKRLLVFEDAKDQGVAENALDELLRNTVISEGFDPEKLMLQDRIFLLFEVRKKSKGSSYSFPYSCPKCKSQSIQNVDLNAFKIIEMPKKYSREVKVTDNISIRLDHILRSEQKLIFDYLNTKEFENKHQKAAEAIIATFAASIKAIITKNEATEDLTLEDKLYLIDEAPESLLDTIKEWIETNSFGVDMTHERVCIHCKNKEKLEIPMSNFF